MSRANIGFFRGPVLLLIACAAARAQDSVGTLSLLPDRLGPMESMFWGQHGAMRKVFHFPLTPEGRESEMHLRRNMLGLHQLGGFVTLAAMASTMFVGQKVYNGQRDLRQIHKALAYTTVAAYFSTATLALFTPPPQIRRNEWSTISAHKLLGTLHFTGMLAMPVLGTLIRDGHAELRPVHLGVGYATLAAFSAALLVITF